MNVHNCTFNEGIEILWGNLGLLLFSETEFNDVLETYEADISMLQLNKCIFNVINQKVKSNININEPGKGFKSFLNIASPDYEKRIKIFNIDSCEIKSDSLTPVLNVILADFNSVGFNDTDFKNTILNFETS